MSLFKAIGDKDIEAINARLAEGVNLNKVYVKGTKITPLEKAIKGGNVEIVKILIDGGADVNKPFSDGITPLLYARNHNFFKIIDVLVEKGAKYDDADVRAEGTEEEKYKGFAKSDIDFFQSIVTAGSSIYSASEDDGNLAENISFCPICLKVIERNTGCPIMYHKCEEPIYYPELLESLSTKEETHGESWWCTFCNRIQYGHTGHPKLAPLSEFLKENLPPYADKLSISEKMISTNECGLPSHEGGGIDEKIGRVQSLLEVACELQKQVGIIDNRTARRRIIEAVWNSPFDPKIKEKIKKIKKDKKFILPEGCVLNTDNSSSDDVFAPDVPLPPELTDKYGYLKDERYPKNYGSDDPVSSSGPTIPNYCFMELGEHEDHREVYGFRHKNKDGIEHGDVINKDTGEWGERICAEDLMTVLRNTNIRETKGKCPITSDCKEKLYPEEIEEIVNYKDYEWYKTVFNRANVPSGGGGKEQTEPILGKMTNAECYLLPPKGGKRRKTYRKKSNRKHTSKKLLNKNRINK